MRALDVHSWNNIPPTHTGILMSICGLRCSRHREMHMSGYMAETALDQALAGAGQGVGLPLPWLLWPSF